TRAGTPAPAPAPPPGPARRTGNGGPPSGPGTAGAAARPRPPTPRRPPPRASSGPHPGVEQGLQHRGGKRRDQHGDRGQARDGGDGVAVVGEDRADEPLPQPVPAEDLLGEGRAGEQGAEDEG